LIQDNFPPVSYGFAYGSGVFVQPDLYAPNAPKGSGPMLDFILAVDSPQEWHAQVQCTQCGAGGGGERAEALGGGACHVAYSSVPGHTNESDGIVTSLKLVVVGTS
jgi:hypothetical protein